MALKGALIKPASSSTTTSKPAKESKLFAPGSYDLKIAKIDVSEPTEKNPAWRKVALTLTNKEETKSVKHFVLMSDTELTYEGTSEAGQQLIQRRFLQLLEGLGLSISVDKLEESLKTFLNKSGKFVNKELSVKIGYMGDFLSKQPGGWVLQNYKGEVKYGPKQSLDELKAELDLKDVKYSKFPEVVSIKKKGA